MQDTPAKVPLGPVLLVNFIGTMGFSIVLPFLVFLVTRFGGNALVYGLVGATYPAFQFVGAPVLGRWSDRFGRKKILLLSQAGTLVAWLVFSVALLLPMTEIVSVRSALLGDFVITLPLLAVFVSRALDGLTGGNISVANAYVADISTDETRSKNFGRMGVASNLGLILGPAAASLLGASSWGEGLPVLAAVVISLVATALIAFALPESLPCAAPWRREAGRTSTVLGQEPRDCVEAARRGSEQRGAVLRQPHIAMILTLYFVIMLSFNFFYAAFPVHAAMNLEWTVVETGIFFSVLSLLLVVVEGPVLSWLSARVSEPVLVVVGALVLGLNFLCMQSHRTAWIYVGAALFAAGNGVMWPSLLSVLARVAGTRLQGSVQGMAGSAGSLASIVGLIAGGIAFGIIGTLTFVVAALLAFASAALSLYLLRLRPGSGRAAPSPAR